MTLFSIFFDKSVALFIIMLISLVTFWASKIFTFYPHAGNFEQEKMYVQVFFSQNTTNKMNSDAYLSQMLKTLLSVLYCRARRKANFKVKT